MKKTFAGIAAAAIILVFLISAALGEEAKFITIREWLDAKGQCGDCMLLLKIKEVVNPVLAIGEDETGTVNLYSGGENGVIIEFANNNGSLTDFWMVIGNPRYNEYEGTIEMADWFLLRLYADAQNDLLKAEITEQTDMIQALRAELEERAEQLASAEARASEQADQIDRLTGENDEKSAKIDSLMAENDDLREQIIELESLVDHYKILNHQDAQWEAAFNDLNDKTTALQALVTEKQNRIEAMEIEIEQLRSRIAELEGVSGEQK